MNQNPTLKSGKKSQFLLKGLTQKQREFLKNYDGATSITAAILALINKEMAREAPPQNEKYSKFVEKQQPSKTKQRIQMSLPENEYLDFVKNHTLLVEKVLKR
ncbi:hypothetical protein MOMA_02655 [Moraxella macacae 0408225]|uniref:Uncharacterized protein n=1 Tax=Moraxella macacae 0408225 TaxID=1230338 RepID=L2F8P0_9GAMM|nr:hypothetical protein [Moraxella macacae]ELA09270.1 hypothetical protein MOMA_02655 [Moraxella macacae 0408225]